VKLAEIKAHVVNQGATFECMGFGATGYAANVQMEPIRVDVNIVESVAHMMAVVRYVPDADADADADAEADADADAICDIGGQDIKVLFLTESRQGGRDVKDFKLSNQCSAGTACCSRRWPTSSASASRTTPTPPSPQTSPPSSFAAAPSSSTPTA
jgi:activator of 2-hydroxyglutaryl-CoA dehydratase